MNDAELFPLVLALARHRRNKLQPEVLCFFSDRLQGLNQGAVQWEWKFEEMESIQFILQRRSSGIMQMLLSSPFRKQEDQFIISHQGEKHMLPLEWDSKYRKAELIALFTHFYQHGYPFSEKDYKDMPLYLLEAKAGQ